MVNKRRRLPTRNGSRYRGPQLTGSAGKTFLDALDIKTGWVAFGLQRHQEARCIRSGNDLCDAKFAQNVVVRLASKDLGERFSRLSTKLFDFPIVLFTPSIHFEEFSGIDSVIVVDFATVCQHLLARTIIKCHVISRKEEKGGTLRIAAQRRRLSVRKQSESPAQQRPRNVRDDAQQPLASARAIWHRDGEERFHDLCLLVRGARASSEFSWLR